MTTRHSLPGFVLLSAAIGAAAGVARADSPPRAPLHLPYRAAGLTDRQAAAHLLDRFAFGARPGEVDRVVSQGIENWLNDQLDGNLPDADLDRRLEPYSALSLTTRAMVQAYPNLGVLRQQAIRDGALTPDDLAPSNQKLYRRKLLDYAQAHEYHLPQELVAQLIDQKIVRAVYGRNQLRERLTDFWFNHFNVSLTNPAARPFILAFERDAIRPHALGQFRDLLGATAKHPAMLLYLDNARSTAPAGATTTLDALGTGARRGRLLARIGAERARLAIQSPAASPAGLRRVPSGATPGSESPGAPAKARPAPRGERGINENYARELMELHTLGVDGGYSQQDVVHVARAFTGWTVLPFGTQYRLVTDRINRFGARSGLIAEDDFLFRPGAHDAEEKRILGRRFPAGGGIAEGERVLDILSASRATARHLAFELAQRFVTDSPSRALIERLSNVYLNSGGDLRTVMRAIAESPEFWSKQAVRSKVKSPFELAVSALRVLDAEVHDPRAIAQWIARIGEPLYAYQAPTGYPDTAREWVNTGALLNRMNFGLQLASGRVPGVSFDLLAANGGREPESAGAALETYLPLLLPGRDVSPIARQLMPTVGDPRFGAKLSRAAAATANRRTEGTPEAGAAMEMPRNPAPGSRAIDRSPARAETDRPTTRLDDPSPAASRPVPPTELMPPAKRPPAALATVVGLILGSPEFQRH